MNDIWIYSIENNVWTWISGSDKSNQRAVYGEKGKPHKENIPGSRLSSQTWYDHQRKILYMFGGIGYNESLSGN